jgi:hypothetical protein
MRGKGFDIQKSYNQAAGDLKRLQERNPLAVRRAAEAAGMTVNPITLGAGNLIAKAGSKLPIAGKLVSTVGRALANPTGADLITAGAGGLASGAVEQAGGSPLAQAGAGLAAALPTGMAIAGAKGLARAAGFGPTAAAPAQAGTELVGNIGDDISAAPEFKKLSTLVRANYRGAKKIEDQAWNAFRDTGRKAVFQPEDTGELAAQLFNKSKTMSLDGAREIERMNNVMENIIKDSGALDIMDVRNIRKLATNLAKSNNTEKAYAGKEALRTIDGFLDDALSSGKLNRMGDKSVKALQEALAISRRNAQTFLDPADVAKIITKDTGNQKYISPETVGSLIAGKSTTHAEAAGTIDAIVKSVAPQNRTRAMEAIRKGVMHNIITRSVTASKNGDVVDMRTLAQNLSSLKRESPSVWAKFSEGQRSQIQRFVNNHASTSGFRMAQQVIASALANVMGLRQSAMTTQAATNFLSSPAGVKTLIRELNSPIPIGAARTFGSTGIPATITGAVDRALDSGSMQQRGERQ